MECFNGWLRVRVYDYEDPQRELEVSSRRSIDRIGVLSSEKSIFLRAESDCPANFEATTKERTAAMPIGDGPKSLFRRALDVFTSLCTSCWYGHSMSSPVCTQEEPSSATSDVSLEHPPKADAMEIIAEMEHPPTKDAMEIIAEMEHFPTEDAMEMIAEMESLGLPISFTARPESAAGRKNRRKKPADYGKRRTPFGVAEHGQNKVMPPTGFCVRSVRLYAGADGTAVEVEEEVVDETVLADGGREEIQSTGCEEANHLHFESEYLPSDKKLVWDTQPVEECAGFGREDVRMSWEANWDEQFQRYYFFNGRTQQSTWEPPPGFEHYSANPLVSGQDNSLGAVSDEKERVWGLKVCSARAMVEQVKVEEGKPAALGQEEVLGLGLEVCSAPAIAEQVEIREGPALDLDRVEVLEEYQGEVVTVHQCEVEKAEVDDHQRDQTEGDFLEEIEAMLPVLPKACCSHIRFRDSEESSSSGEIREGEGVDWDEIDVEKAMHLAKEGTGEEEGFQACSTSEDSIPSVKAKSKRQSKRENNGFKKRRLMGFSVTSYSPQDWKWRGDKVQLPGMVEMMHKKVIKYWFQRYSLFAKYDQGIKMDDEGWFSVTPEVIAKHQASRCAMGLVIDAFTGVGGNAIQFALKSLSVIAIDINPERIEYARHNAKIYGVADKIDFIVGDFFQLAPSLKADVVFLSPPWGGPEYLKEEIYDVHTMLQPKDGCTLIKVAQAIAPNIVLFLPRNVSLNQLEELSWVTSPPLPCEVEENFVNNKLKAKTAYFGQIADQDI